MSPLAVVVMVPEIKESVEDPYSGGYANPIREQVCVMKQTKNRIKNRGNDLKSASFWILTKKNQ